MARAAGLGKIKKAERQRQQAGGQARTAASGAAQPSAQPVVHQIVRRIVADYHDELGYSVQPGSWPRHLSRNAGISLGTARNLLGVDRNPPRKVSDRVLASLAAHFTQLPGFGGLTGSKIGNARSAEAFLALRSTTVQKAQEQLVTLSIRRRNSFETIAAELVGTYVAYRYAFESGSLERRIAREVVHIERQGHRLPFKMSYKLGPSDAGEKARMCEGEAMPLGKSAMCVGTSTSLNNPGYLDWASDLDRGRVLFFRRNIDPSVNDLAKFAILATTRADGNFEPCCACTILIRAVGQIGDLDDFMRRVTVVRPYEEIMMADFAGLSAGEKSQHQALAAMLENVPHVRDVILAGAGEKARAQDRVLKLWHDRFAGDMPSIIQTVQALKKTKAPFKENWRECTNLAP